MQLQQLKALNPLHGATGPDLSTKEMEELRVLLATQMAHLLEAQEQYVRICVEFAGNIAWKII